MNEECWYDVSSSSSAASFAERIENGLKVAFSLDTLRTRGDTVVSSSSGTEWSISRTV